MLRVTGVLDVSTTAVPTVPSKAMGLAVALTALVLAVVKAVTSHLSVFKVKREKQTQSLRLR